MKYSILKNSDSVIKMINLYNYRGLLLCERKNNNKHQYIFDLIIAKYILSQIHKHISNKDYNDVWAKSIFKIIPYHEI